MTVTLTTTTRPTRQCGDCTLCCKLLPMKRGAYPPERVRAILAEMIKRGLATESEFDGMVGDFDKPAGQRCPHQRYGCGCAIYPRRPAGCRFWNCQWLGGVDTADLRRPDRAGYVIDIMPDFIVVEGVNVECVQIWINPKRPDAWREDKALLAFLERRGREGKVALLRLNSWDSIARFPASMSSDGQPHEVSGRAAQPARSAGERFDGLRQCRNIKLEVPK